MIDCPGMLRFRVRRGWTASPGIGVPIGEAVPVVRPSAGCRTGSLAANFEKFSVRSRSGWPVELDGWADFDGSRCPRARSRVYWDRRISFMRPSSQFLTRSRHWRVSQSTEYFPFAPLAHSCGGIQPQRIAEVAMEVLATFAQ